jgi:hypothetical protein
VKVVTSQVEPAMPLSGIDLMLATRMLTAGALVDRVLRFCNNNYWAGVVACLPLHSGEEFHDSPHFAIRGSCNTSFALLAYSESG